MLTRRHIRVKVLQSVYAFLNQLKATKTTENPDIQKQEKFLNYSMEQMYELYLLLLQLMVEIQLYADGYIKKSQNKHLATESDKKPNRKFVENKVLKQIASNTAFKNALEKYKLQNWEIDNEYVHLLFKELRSSDLYTSYLNSKDSSYQEDKSFLIRFYKEILAPNEKLYDYLEDKRLTWLDDFPIVNTAIVKMLQHISPKTENHKMLLSLYKNDDDKDFAVQLFRKTILNNETLETEISDNSPNWDKERIAELDFIMIKMGLMEFMHFPSIPVKVTINEYLEIAKEYSTPKSSIFINGLLDKKAKEYKTENKLNKVGRGLL